MAQEHRKELPRDQGELVKLDILEEEARRAWEESKVNVFYKGENYQRFFVQDVGYHGLSIEALHVIAQTKSSR